MQRPPLQSPIRNHPKQELTLYDIPYEDYKGFIKYACSKIDTREFPRVKERALRILADPNCPSVLKIVIGEWFFTKLDMMYRMPQDKRVEITDKLQIAVKNCTSEIPKSKYIYFHNIDACTEMMVHFYQQRFNDDYFILQMVNDSHLLRWQQNLIPADELREHFLRWIQSTPNLDQQSNLLDVLLSYFKDDEDVRDIYKKMSEGDSIYDNAQNVHDETISAAVNTAVCNLMTWHYQNYPALGERDTPDSYTQFVFGSFNMTSKQNEIYRGIWQRTMIDKTPIKLNNLSKEVLELRGNSVCAFDVLFALANLLNSHRYKNSIFNSLMEDMEEGVSLCISGYFARFMSCLQGYDDRFNIQIPFFDQLYAKVSSMVMNKVQKLPEDSEILLGTYDEEYQGQYFDFLINTLDLSALCQHYGRNDVLDTITAVMKKFTGQDIWKIENGTLFYTS